MEDRVWREIGARLSAAAVVGAVAASTTKAASVAFSTKTVTKPQTCRLSLASPPAE